MSTFEAVDYEFCNIDGITVEQRDRIAKTVNIGIAIRQIFKSIIVSSVEIRFKTSVSTCSDFSSECHVVDQISGND